MTDRYKQLTFMFEVIGVIAIILSLVFVGFQIKQSNNIARSSMYHDLNIGMNQTMGMVIADEELIELFVLSKGKTTYKMTVADKQRVSYIWKQGYRIYDTAFYSYKYSVLGENEWKRIKNKACQNKELMGEQLWFSVKGAVSEEFVSLI